MSGKSKSLVLVKVHGLMVKNSKRLLERCGKRLLGICVWKYVESLKVSFGSYKSSWNLLSCNQVTEKRKKYNTSFSLSST